MQRDFGSHEQKNKTIRNIFPPSDKSDTNVWMCMFISICRTAIRLIIVYDLVYFGATCTNVH